MLGDWYVALLVFPVLILAVLLALTTLISPEFAPIFFPAGILIGLFTGFFEETGWMGYAFPKMQVKRNALATAILLGVLHVLWHIVPDYIGASSARGAYWLPHFLAMMLVAMTAMRILIVWVYVNTRSLLLAQLMHASSTGFLAMLVDCLLLPRWGVGPCPGHQSEADEPVRLRLAGRSIASAKPDECRGLEPGGCEQARPQSNELLVSAQELTRVI